jgi:hypothetical protein
MWGIAILGILSILLILSKKRFSFFAQGLLKEAADAKA